MYLRSRNGHQSQNYTMNWMIIGCFNVFEICNGYFEYNKHIWSVLEGVDLPTGIYEIIRLKDDTFFFII